jgi:hypothetical protein
MTSSATQPSQRPSERNEPKVPALTVVALIGRPVPRWLGMLLAELADADLGELRLFEVPDGHPEPDVGAVFRAYEHLDRRLFSAYDALEASETPATAGSLQAERFGGRSVLLPEALSEIRSQEPDVVLDFAGVDLGQLSEVAPYGAWTLLFGSPERAASGPVAFWEALDRETVIESALVAVTGSPASRTLVLRRSFAAIDSVSLQRTRERVLWKTRHFVVRGLRDLRELGWAELQANAEAIDLPLPSNRRPRAAKVVGHAALVAGGVVGRRIRRLGFRDPWFVGIRSRTPGSVEAILAGRQSGPSFRPALADPDASFADPFLVDWDGVSHLFFERSSYTDTKGSLWVCELSADGAPGEAMPILEADHHLSYPHVFSVEGAMFLLPESAERHSVDLYECVSFPDSWALRYRLLDGVMAADPTLIAHDGRYWLFVNLFDTGASPDDELHVYFSDSLSGPWQSHPANPVVSDVRRARCAGRIIRLHGQLVRPAQDCAREYGSAITFNRIDTLTCTAYAETPLGRLDASWSSGLSATHTYGFDERFEVVDGRRLRPRPRLERAFRLGGRRLT